MKPNRIRFVSLIAICLLSVFLIFGRAFNLPFRFIPSTVFSVLPKSKVVQQNNVTTQEQTKDKVKDKDGPHSPPEKKKRSVEIEALQAAARQGPPELAAELLLGISSKLIDDAEWKVEILDEIFHLSSGAKNHFKKIVIDGIHYDTDVGMLTRAFSLNLDSLSIQCRALKLLTKIDSRKALELTKELSPIEIKSLGCEDSMVYDFRDYYDTLTEVANTCFSPQEREKKTHLSLISRHLQGINSPAQITPVMKMLAELTLSSDELISLLSNLTEAIARISRDERSFFYWAAWPDSTAQLDRLALKCESLGIDTKLLFKAYRKYLTKFLSGDRCMDIKNLKLEENGLPKFVNTFNKVMQERLPSQNQVYIIVVEEIQSNSSKEAGKYREFWQATETKDFLRRLKQLHFGKGKTLLSDEEKESEDWKIELSNFLNDFEVWQPSLDMSDIDAFHHKCSVYESLISVVPRKLAGADISRKYVVFLYTSNQQFEHPSEWYWHVYNLFTAADKSSDPQRLVMIEAFSAANNPVMNLMAEFTKIKALAANPTSKP